MKNIYFTSDTHYSHKNIVRGVSEWKVEDSPYGVNRTRDFNTLEEHNDALVTSINALAKCGDVLYCLGDWSFGDPENIRIFRSRLICKEVHLILGNHDQHIRKPSSPFRGCFNSVQDYLELSLKIDSQKSGQYGKTKICMSHYAQRVWNKSHHGAIHLYGHSHGTLPGIGKSMDVGVDTNNLYPYHLDEILDLMKGKEISFIDHHSPLTN